MSAPFASLADIEALERTPYEDAIPERTTYGLIERSAVAFPDRTAFVYLPDGELSTPPQRVTYRELLANIQRAANLFRSLGVDEGSSVAILAPNIPATQYALWGAQLAGRACPINFMLQPEHIAALLEAANVKVVVTFDTLAVPGLDKYTVLQIGSTFEAALSSSPVGWGPAQRDPSSIASFFHTGGTTGAPKLVQHTHANEAHTSWFAHRFYGFDENTVEINGFPLFHVAGAFVYGLALLAIGATQVLPTPTGMRNAAFMRNYWRFCEREAVTALACVPTILAGLCNLEVDADISKVKVAYTGGSPLPTELAARFESATGIPVRNILGMTECAGLVSIEPLAAPRVPGSAGLRMPYSEVKVRDDGVIALRGPHVSPGYTDAKRNAGMFEDGWLVSGDLGRIDAQGYIHVTGRAKDVIIRGSHNIDPGVVEEAFLAHPAVAMCAVVAEPDAHSGEVPMAFVTLKPGASADGSTLLAEVAPHVYERPAVPRRVIVLDAMPVTAIGKIFKPALRLRAAEVKLRELFGVDVTVTEDGAVVHSEDSGRMREKLGAIALKVDFRP